VYIIHQYFLLHILCVYFRFQTTGRGHCGRDHMVWRIKVMVFNATFNNISVISWRSVLLVEETGENHWPCRKSWQTLSHNVVSGTWLGIKLPMLVVIGAYCIGSCKFSYHMVTTTMASPSGLKFVKTCGKASGFLRFPPPIKLTATI
jgi:hypothetical protein